ncbi:MAG TPA: hypothetical protein VM183_20735 [Burkholderiales bacterium]|nr:hypothetical protein [Burkholderiales bacterium]
MRKAQRGGAVGASVIIGALAVAGYYAYTQFTAPKVPPSCSAQLNSCVTNCRKTNTEAPALQTCQEACQRDAAACK